MEKKTAKELFEMAFVNLIKEVTELKANEIFERCLIFSKDRKEKSRVQGKIKRLMEKETKSNPLIEELNQKIRGSINEKKPFI